ncbi:serine hydrolase domain-containing protein [Nocardia lasii]|uniref:Serine hydrolase domain-containing protein n=1 Tax=Nocardia lasii TaxID=1616107 RepID=A0ABW1JNQ2_9NOCA
MRTLTVAICAVALLISGSAVGSAEPVAVRADLEGVVRSGAVGGIATVTERGENVVATAGRAEIGSGAPISAEVAQYVRVGSVTKTFTAAIVLQLVSEGRVELDASVETYLPGVLVGDGVDGRAITVRQVLGHRSGLPEPASAELDEYRAAVEGRTFTPAQEISLALAQPARFAPGARFEYTNANYIVAGMVIEAVTGRTYVEELRGRILGPLGLSNTYLPATGETGLRAPHPTGYSTMDGSVTDTTRMEPSLPWAAGALVSTGADLNRFYLALLAGQVVPLPQVRAMLDGVDMGNGDGMSYGLGVGYAELPCGAQYVGHIGGVRGFTTISGATAEGRAVTYSFTGTPSALDIGGLLARALCG